MDSIGLIAKNKLTNDQRNKQKNNIVVLCKKNFLRGVCHEESKNFDLKKSF